MLGFRDNIVIATHILANAGRMAPAAEQPLDRFVTNVSKAYLKSKKTRLTEIVAFCDAVGKQNFLTVADKLNAVEATALLRRLDPHNAERAKADPSWARMRLAKVLTGEEVPELPSLKAKARRQPRTTVARASIMDNTDAFSAKRCKRNETPKITEPIIG